MKKKLALIAVMLLIFQSPVFAFEDKAKNVPVSYEGTTCNIQLPKKITLDSNGVGTYNINADVNASLDEYSKINTTTEG